uniref:R-type lectin 2 n=1 Tax=Mytilisepta virgata TaxID=2547956 RepID=A0A646QV51_MYTVI|nr:R-type lectin 2 [Mytilisepta virgata]
MSSVTIGKCYIQNRENGGRAFYNLGRKDLGIFAGKMYDDQIWTFQKSDTPGYYTLGRESKFLQYDGKQVRMSDIQQDNTLWSLEEVPEDKGFSRLLNKVHKAYLDYNGGDLVANKHQTESEKWIWFKAY